MKKGYTIVLLICLVLFILSAVYLLTPYAHCEEVNTITQVSDLEAALAGPDTDIVLYLSASFETEQQITIPSGKRVSLASSEATQTITRATAFTGCFFEIEQDASLILSNLVLDGNAAHVAMARSLVYNCGELVLLDGAVLQNNSADIGGGVYNSGTFLIEGDALITGNSVSGEYTGLGGGVMNSGFVRFEMTAGAITNNTATANGGGIYAVGETSTAWIGGTAQITGNRAQAGGGIYNAATMTLDGATVANNVADSGGGIKHTHMDIYRCALTVGGGALITGNSAHEGGGIHNESLCEIADAGIIGNYAEQTGGGIYNADVNAELALLGATEIANNEAENGGGLACLDEGLCIFSDGVDVHNNTAQNGGGIAVMLWWNYGGAAVHMDGGFIRGNTADNGGGVFLESEGLSFSMAGGEISENTASQGGGVWSAGSLEVYAGVIMQNYAEEGGGIFTRGATHLYGGVIEGNAADDNGGGVFMDSGVVALDGTAQIGKALGSGDGIFLCEDTVLSIGAQFSGYVNVEAAENPYDGIPIARVETEGTESQNNRAHIGCLQAGYYVVFDGDGYVLEQIAATFETKAATEADEVAPYTDDGSFLPQYTIVLMIMLVTFFGIRIKQRVSAKRMRG